MKLPFNPFQTQNTLEGVLYAQRQLVDQPVTTTSDVRFRSCRVDTDVLIEGNLQVTGSTTVLDTETIQLKDQIIEINADRRPMTQAGIQINRADSESYLFVFDESTRLFKVGTAANSKSVATVQDHPPPLGIAVWDPLQGTFDVTNVVNIPMTLTQQCNVSRLDFDDRAQVSVDPENRLSIESQAGISLVHPVFAPELWIRNVRITSTAGELVLQDPVTMPRLNLGAVSLFASGSTLVTPDSMRVGGDLVLESLRFPNATLATDPQGHLTVVSEKSVVITGTSAVLPETYLADRALRVSKIDNNAVLSSPANMVLQTQDYVDVPNRLRFGDDLNYIQSNQTDLNVNAARDVVIQSRYCVVAALKIQDATIVRENESLVIDTPGDVRFRGQALVLADDQPLVLAQGVSITGSGPSLTLTAPASVQIDSDEVTLKSSAKLCFGALADVLLSSDQKCVVRAPNGLITNALTLAEFIEFRDGGRIQAYPDRLVLDHPAGILLTGGPIRITDLLTLTTGIFVDGTVHVTDVARFDGEFEVSSDVIRVGADQILRLDRGFHVDVASVTVSNSDLVVGFPQQAVFGSNRLMRYDTRDGVLDVETVQASSVAASALVVTGQLNVMDLVIQRNITFPDQVDFGSTVAIRTGSVQLNGDVAISGSIFLANARVDGHLDAFSLSVAGADLKGSRIQDLGSPQVGSDAATKEYVDSVAAGLSVKQPVKAATIDNMDVTAPVTALDGVLLNVGDRILVKNQINPVENGIYVLVGGGPLLRADDLAAFTEAGGAFVFVTEGARYAGNGFVVSEANVQTGVDPLTWVQFSGAPDLVGSGGIERIGNTFSLRISDHFGIGQGGQLQIASAALGTGLVGGSNSQIHVSETLPHVTAVGTISQGTWHGSTIDVAHGGTGITTFPSNRVMCTSATSTYVFHDTLVFDGARMKIGSGILDPGSTLTVHGDLMANGALRFGNGGTIVAPCLVLDSNSVRIKTVYVDPAGNVGINTDSPTNPLHVSGSMRASNVIVDGTLWLSQEVSINGSGDRVEIRMLGQKDLAVVGGSLRLDETKTHVLGALELTGNVLSVSSSLTFQVGGDAQVRLTPDSLVLQNQALELNPGPNALRLSLLSPVSRYQLQSSLPLNVDTQVFFTKGIHISDVLTVEPEPGVAIIRGSAVAVDNVPWSFTLGQDTVGFHTYQTKSQWVTSPGVDVVCQGSLQLAGECVFQTCNGVRRPLGALGWWYLGRLGIGTTVIRVDGYFDVKFVYDGVAAYTPHVTIHDRQTVNLHIFKQPLGAYQVFLYTLRTAVVPATDVLDFTTGTATGSASTVLGTLTVDDTAVLSNVVVTRALRVNAGATLTGPLAIKDPDGLWISGPSGDLASLSPQGLVLENTQGSKVEFKQDFTTASAGLTDRNLTFAVTGLVENGIRMTVPSGPALHIKGDRTVTVDATGPDAFTVTGGIQVGRDVVAQGLVARSLVLNNDQDNGSIEFQCDTNGNLSIGSKGIKNVSPPTEYSDAATKGYVDSLIQGVTAKKSVKAIATEPVDLLLPPTTIDDILILESDRVLLVAQPNSVDNGLYTWTNGAYERSSDLPTGSRASGIYVFVTTGARYANSGFLCSNPAVGDVVGTDPLTFVQFNGAAQVVTGMGLRRVANEISVQVDDQSIEIAANKLRLKSSGLGLGLSGGSGQPLTVSSINHLSALGTITSGRWQAGVIGLQYGGTGASSFLAGQIPFSNGKALTQGLLHFDAVNNRLGINTTVPVAGLNVHERDVCLTRNSVTPCHVLFTSAADNAMASLRFQESQLIWSLGPGTAKTDLIDQVRITQQGEVVARGPVKGSVFVADATVFGPQRIWKTSPGLLVLDVLTSDASGSSFRFYGTTGSVDDSGNGEYLSVGYDSGQYAVKTGYTGSGIPKTLYLQSGNNVGQVILRPDGSIHLADSVAIEATEVTISQPLVVTQPSDFRGITVDSVNSRGGIALVGSLVFNNGLGSVIMENSNLVVAAPASTSLRTPAVRYENETGQPWLSITSALPDVVSLRTSSATLGLAGDGSEFLLSENIVVNVADHLDLRGSLKLPGVDLAANGPSVFSYGARMSESLTCTDVTVSGVLTASAFRSDLGTVLFDNCQELRLGLGPGAVQVETPGSSTPGSSAPRQPNNRSNKTSQADSSTLELPGLEAGS
ncbi:hypothetical protein HK102_008332, partial [Quaeritorhiza haematococci]